MWSRAIAVLISSWLPCLAAVLPFGRVFTINAMISGLAATALSGWAMVDDRARTAVCALGAWVAATPFFLRSSLLETVVAVCWGVSMFVFMGGPFSAEPEVSRVSALVPRAAAPREEPQHRAAA